MIRYCLSFVAIVAALANSTRPADAQSALVAQCARPEVVAADAQAVCVAAAQTAISGQPIVGLLFGGGNPSIGYGAGGLRLGVVPRVSLGARVNLVSVNLPDIADEAFSGGEDDFLPTFATLVPALVVDASVGLTDGFDSSPSMGGIGALSLVGTVGFVPLSTDDGLDQSDFAYGIGARVQILRESFVAPGIAISVVHRRLNTASFGNICPSGSLPSEDPVPEGESVEVCLGGGDPGEVSFDLTDWSGRATVMKNFLGLAGVVGVGYDQFGSDLDFGVRSPLGSGSGGTPVFRFVDDELESSKWVVFTNLSLNFPVLSLTAEAGWQQGSAPISGFSDIDTNFDPGSGTLFGGVGVRISL